MPKIPDVSTIERRNIGVTETIAREDISSAGVAMAAQAKALQGIAVDLNELDEAKAKEELTKAQTQMRGVYSETLKKFHTDGDYQTLPTRIDEEVSKQKGSVVSSLKNKRAIQAFEEWDKEKQIGFKENVFQLAWGKEVSQQRRSIDESLNLLKKQVVDGDISDSAWIAQDIIDSGEKLGYLEPEESGVMLQEWKDDTVLSGINSMEDPNKQIEALNSTWAQQINEDKRLRALASAQERKKQKDLDDFALSAANLPTRSESLEQALDHPDNKYDAVKKTLDIRNQMESATNADTMNNIYQNQILKGVFNRNSPEMQSLNWNERKEMEALYEREKAGIKETDPDVHRYATTLASEGDWPELQEFILGRDGMGNPFMSVDDRKKYQDMIAKGKASGDIKDESVIKEVFGTTVTGSGVGSKNRLVRATNLLNEFKAQYKEAYGKDPDRKEIEQAVMDMKSEYDVDWSIFDEPIVDADYHEARKLFRDAQVNRIKEVSPKEYEFLESKFGGSISTMSQFEIQRHVRNVEKIQIIKSTNPELYQDTVDAINAKGGDDYRDFLNVYNQLRKLRNQ